MKVTICGDPAEAAAAAFIISRAFSWAGVVETPNIRYTAALKTELFQCMTLSEEALGANILTQVQIHFAEKDATTIPDPLMKEMARGFNTWLGLSMSGHEPNKWSASLNHIHGEASVLSENKPTLQVALDNAAAKLIAGRRMS
jgi:hypothetical protein